MKGKARKESAASHQFRTQKQKEQLENMEKRLEGQENKWLKLAFLLEGGTCTKRSLFI